MILGMYSIRDFKSGFLSPTVEVNDMVARRNFEHAVLNSDQSLFFSHPEDYALFKIGEMDTDMGVISPVVPVAELLTATQVFGSPVSQRVKGGGMSASDES